MIFPFFFGTGDAIEAATFAQTTALPDRFYFLWSSADTQMPTGAITPAISALRGQLGVQVRDAGIQGHVLSNSDMDIAEELVEFLLGPEDSADDTGTDAD